MCNGDVLAAAAEFKCMAGTRRCVTGKVYCIYIAFAANDPHPPTGDVSEIVLEFEAAALFVEREGGLEQRDCFLAEPAIPVHLAAAIV